MEGLREALRHLERGDWQQAHRIVQDGTSTLACWAHGIVHLMEGDRANAGYWYRRAGRDLPTSPDVAAEVAALARALPADPSAS
jgi:hypothetical protein